MAKEKETLSGRRADGSLGQVYAYRFDSEAPKRPVRELVNARGWELRDTKLS